MGKAVRDNKDWGHGRTRIGGSRDPGRSSDADAMEACEHTNGLTD